MSSSNDLSSLYPQAVNPLQNLGNVASISNAVVQNKLQQQQLQARQGVAQLYADAPKDTSGNPDQNWITQNAPRYAGVNTPDVIQQSIQAQQLRQAADQAKMVTGRAKASIIGASMLPVINDPNASPASMVAALNAGKAASNGIVTDADYAPIFQSMANTLVQGGGMPAQQADAIRKHAQQVVGTQLAVGGDLDAGSKLLFGTPLMQHTGGGTVGGVQNPVTGAITQGSYTPDTLPATAPTVDATGQPKYIGGSGAPVTQQAGAGASPGAGGSGAPGTVPAGPPPGLTEAASHAGGAAADAYNSDVQTAKGYPARMIVLNKALGALQNTSTGPGTGSVNDIKSFLLAQSPDALKTLLPGVDPNDIKSYDEANKYLTQYAAAAAAAVGPHTDSGLATALTGNANTHISNLAAQDVVKTNIALEKAKQLVTAQYVNAKSSQLQPGQAINPQDYNDYTARAIQQVDPRAFLIDQMKPADAKKMYLSIKDPAEKQRFQNTYDMGVQNNLIQPVAGSQAAQ